MPKTADEFLNHLQTHDLVAPEVVENLRRQVAAASKPVSPATIARLLVEKGHLTAAQSQRILGAAAPPAANSSGNLTAQVQPKKTAPPKPPSDATARAAEMGLTPLGDDTGLTPLPPAKPSAPKAESPLDLASMGLTPLEDLLAPLPGQPTPAKPQAASPARVPPPAKAAPKLEELGLTPLDDKPASPSKPKFDPTKTATVSATKTTPAPGKSAVVKKAPASPGASGTKLPAATAPVAKAKTTAPKVEGLTPVEGLSPLEGLSPIEGLSPLETASPLTPLEPLAGGDLLASSPAPLAAAAADPLLAASELAPAAPATAPAKAAPAGPRKTSRVIPILAGVVVILSIAAGVTYFIWPRGTGEAEFNLAEQDYSAKQYTGAIGKYEEFLKKYPRAPKAPLARVHLGMAKLLAAGKDNWPAILPVAKELTAQLADEPELKQVHGELAPLLSDLACGLTESARSGASAEETTSRAAEAREALALANDARFVPGSLRPWQRLAEAEESLALLARDQERDKALDAALGEMQKSLDAKKAADVYAARGKLLASYPELANDTRLRDFGAQIAAVEVAGVKSIEVATKGEKEEAKSAVLTSVTLASPSPSPKGGAAGRIFFARAAGSISALDGEKGQLLWQRYVGGQGHDIPLQVSDTAPGDVVITDHVHSEVVCIDSKTGQLRWRHPCDGPIAGQVVLPGQVIVSLRDGRVIAVDAGSGNAKAGVQIPQKLSLPAVPGDKGTQLYQMAEHSHLYCLAGSSLKCDGAVYIGHEPGSALAPPAMLPRHLAVAENRGPDSAVLYLVALDNAGIPGSVSQRIDLPGNVAASPQWLGERLVVLTDRGGTLAFEYGSEPASPLKKIGETAPRESDSILPLTHVDGARLWVADVGLRKFDFPAATGGLKEQWAGLKSGVFVSPPQVAGDVVFSVRREPGRPGVIAAANKASNGGTLWETDLAVPLASPLLVDGKSVTLVSQLGAKAKIDLESLQGSTAIEAFNPVEASPSAAASAGTIPQRGDSPAPWAGGILTCSSSGALSIVHLETGALLADAYQLPIQAGSGLATWSYAPAGSDEVVVSDGRQGLHHLRLESAPQPHLIELASTKLEAPAISQVAVLGSTALIVDDAGELRAFDLPGLKAGPTAKLSARSIVYGPVPAGKLLLVATDKGELVFLDAGLKSLAVVPLQDGPPTGMPAVVSGDIVVATRRGTLLRLDGKSGELIARSDLGQPLSGGPVLAGESLLVPTAAGNLLKVKVPEKEGSK